MVASAHTPKGLREAQRLRRGSVGFVEIRLDSLAHRERSSLLIDLHEMKVPILLTARHPSEGGANRLDVRARRTLLETFGNHAEAIDVELRSAAAMSDILEAARRRKTLRIISFHDFRGTPHSSRLRQIVRQSARAGADIVKIATHLRRPEDLATLLVLQASTKIPLATMGMGPLGKVSRLVLAAAGSRLNYGYVDKPQVPGQWPALQLADRLEEVMP